MLEKSLESCKEFVKKTIKDFKAINQFKRIETGNIQKGKRQMVFACFYIKNATPYKHYPHVPEEYRNKTIPLVLMQVRWDGRLGFPGGEVDPGENLLTAIQRELREELNLDLEKLKTLDLKPLTTFSSKRENIHSFSCEIEDEDVIKDIARNSSFAEHYVAENCGSVLIQIVDFKGKGYHEFLRNRFSGTAKKELKELVRVMNLITY